MRAVAPKSCTFVISLWRVKYIWTATEDRQGLGNICLERWPPMGSIQSTQTAGNLQITERRSVLTRESREALSGEDDEMAPQWRLRGDSNVRLTFIGRLHRHVLLDCSQGVSRGAGHLDDRRGQRRRPAMDERCRETSSHEFALPSSHHHRLTNTTSSYRCGPCSPLLYYMERAVSLPCPTSKPELGVSCCSISRSCPPRPCCTRSLSVQQHLMRTVCTHRFAMKFENECPVVGAAGQTNPRQPTPTSFPSRAQNPPHLARDFSSQC